MVSKNKKQNMVSVGNSSQMILVNQFRYKWIKMNLELSCLSSFCLKLSSLSSNSVEILEEIPCIWEGQSTNSVLLTF